MLCAPTGPASSPEKSVPFCSIVSHSARKPWYTVGQLGNEMGQAPSAAQRRPVGSVPRSKYSTYVRYCRWVRWVSSSSSKRDGGFETRPYVQAGEARTVVQPTGWGSQDCYSTHSLGKPGRSFNPRLGKSGRSFNPQAGEARTVVQLTGWGSQDGRSTHRLGKPGRSFNPRLGKPGRSFNPTGWGSQNGSFNPQAGEARTGRSTPQAGEARRGGRV